MRARFTVSVFALVSIWAMATPAIAQTSGGRCADRFVDSVFETEAEAGPVLVYGSGITQTLLDRYAADWAELVDLVQAEMGGLDVGVAVCVFDDKLPLDAEELGWPRNQFLRAIALGEERLVVVSSWLIAETPDAGRNGLLHIAQYQVSDGSYPEPFGNEVKGWYRNRVDRTVENVHNTFVRQNAGLAAIWQPFPWTVGQMVDPLLWNPEFGYGGAGDFANYAVATGGDAVLSNPLGSDLAGLDEAWRQSLFDESGAVLGGSKGWLLGLGLAIGIILLGILMAWWGHRQRLAVEAKMGDLAWLEQASREAHQREAVRTSVPSGRGRRNPRVGRTRAGTGGIDSDHGDGTPSGRAVRATGDRVADASQTGDDLFRHPGLDGEN